MSGIAAPQAPAAPPTDRPLPLLQPDQMEGMFAGLDKMAEALPMEKKQQMDELLQSSVDPEGDKAGWANVAFLADRYGKDPQEMAQNADAYRQDYAKQMFHVESDVDDKAFYGMVGKHFQTMRDERGLLTEAQGKLFDAFRSGEGDWKGSFQQAVAEMRGKPGFDPKRLDIYRNLADQQWKAWNEVGSHHPAAIEALTDYFKTARKGVAPGEEEKALQQRQAALAALQTIPEDEQDAVLGLAVRGTPKQEEQWFMEKAANRVDRGIADLGSAAITAAKDLITAGPQGQMFGLMVANQSLRRPERKLDQFVAGQVDPETSKNWLAKGVLGAAEGLPSMMAMFTPPGIAVNLAAFSEEARGHFEDAGVPAEKAAILGPLAGLGLTALQTVNSQVLLGKGASRGLESWMGANLAGKTGSALVRGYAKNVLAAGAVDTAVLGTITMGQQLTEPAIQSVAAQLDRSIPGIQWTGPKGELAMLARATPETLASLVPLVVLGTGMGVLRSREFARNTVHNEGSLRAVGLPEEAVTKIMAAKDPEHAVLELQEAFEKREPNAAAVEKENAQNRNQSGAVVTVETKGFGEGGLTHQIFREGENVGSVETFSNGDGTQGISMARVKYNKQGIGTAAYIEINNKLKQNGERLASGPFGEMSNAARALWRGLVREGHAIGNQGEEAKGHAFEFKRESDKPPVSLAPDGTYLVKDEAGHVIDQAGSAEMAAKAMKEHAKPDLAGEGLGTKRAAPMHFGIIDPRMQQAMQFVKDGIVGLRNIWKELRGLPQFGKFKEVLNEFNAENQRRAMILAGEVRQVFDAVPDKLTRRAMYRAIEAGFDKDLLREWANGSDRLSSKKAYEAALKLTPDQIAYAKKVQAWFEAKHPQAVEAGLLEAEQKRKNYVPLMVDQPSELKGNANLYGGKLKGDFSHAITREFENSFSVENARDEKGENLGLKLKSDDLPEVMAAYGAELDKVDLTRQALKALESSKAKASDNEPLVQPVRGMLSTKPEGGSTISNPSATISESGVKYETLDHPAFKKWYYAGKDLEGKPVMFRGEMGLHPEIYGHLANILGKSKLQVWADSPGGAVAHLAKTSFKALQEAQRFVKANMFALSAFHATHIGTRAAGNLVAPWELKRVEANDPGAQDAMKHGLQLFSDRAAQTAVQEGLGESNSYNLTEKIPGVGKIAKAVTDLTFHEIIPRYKLESWRQLNAKNQKLFAKDIADGRATPAQVKYLTSQQVNARFGEQNYADLGLDPTWKHILSLTTLAPDFWRSNMQNFKQVGMGLTGAKSGREPAKAFVITAGVTWLTARILNKALSEDDSYHFDDPFAVHVGNRTYTFRTEVQDVAHMATHPNQYLMGRLSPFGSATLEYLSGVNWRGEKVNIQDVLKETATKAIPASLKFLPGPSEAAEWGEGHRATTSHFEQFLTSQGIKVGRSTPLNAAYELARDYKKAIGKDDKEGTYPVSKFQQLRYALEDGDTEKARKELATLAEKEPIGKLSVGLHSAIFHPWTGSHRSDMEFKASLSSADLAKVEKAEAHRKAIWADFRKLKADTSAESEPSEEP